ncbi:hypothetical protein QAD02_017440 [Eretmocerus hayati]|uniref:Uncharacterized protein n=1 Tax=Eretmocerus hayati TaxID=131215 RepID=A0ACC2PEZ9_9HYME|nr:hypothetical protein QAD02_017440 [Eretmocerus hayati]
MIRVCRLFLFFLLFSHWSHRISRAEPISGENLRLVKEKEYTFVVSIQARPTEIDLKGRHICTGALISRKHVLTAEHCLKGKSLSLLQVVLASSDFTKRVVHKIKTWISYEKWARIHNEPIRHENNDIAVLTLARKVLEPDVKPAQLSKKKESELNWMAAQMVGWQFANSDTTKPILFTGTVSIFTKEYCNDLCAIMLQSKEESRKHFHRNYICTMTTPSVLATQGDSGGPLFYKNDKILAVTIKGTKPTCAEESNRMTIHLSIDNYRKFLNDVISNDR